MADGKTTNDRRAGGLGLGAKRIAKAAGVSFSDLQRMVSAAIKDAWPVPAPMPGSNCSPCEPWIRDLFDDYAVVEYDGGLYKIGYAYANGVVALTSQPVAVVEQYVEAAAASAQQPQETTMATKAAAVKKDDTDPGAAGPAGGAGDGSGDLGGDGADIVLLALQRLSDICDAIEAGGGVLTADLKTAVDGAVSLLGAVAPDEPDGDEGTDNGLAGEEGQPEPMSAAAKAEVQALKRRTAQSKAFMRRLAKMIRKAEAEPDEEKKKAAKAAIAKALDYGNEAFGSETAWMSASLGENIPEFTDPAQLKPQEVATPAPANPKGQYAEDPNYTPNANSQVAYQAGSGDIMEKLANLRKRVTGGTTTPVAKSNPAHAEWGPAYLATLPDTAFLHVEPGVLKDAAGRSNLLQGPSTGFRHYAVKDINGKLSGPQVRKAMAEIPNAGLLPEVKSSLLKQAQDLLKQVEAFEASAITKSARADDGWPLDMNDPEFVAGLPAKVPAFGFDAISQKHAEVTKAAEAATAGAK